MSDMNKTLTIEETKFVSDIHKIVYTAKEQAFRTANIMMVVSNWLVGHRIVLQEQNGQGRAEYGKRIISIASEELTRSFGKGYSETTLRNYRKFYLQFSGMQIQQPLLAEFQSKATAIGLSKFANLKMCYLACAHNFRGCTTSGLCV